MQNSMLSTNRAHTKKAEVNFLTEISFTIFSKIAKIAKFDIFKVHRIMLIKAM